MLLFPSPRITKLSAISNGSLASHPSLHLVTSVSAESRKTHSNSMVDYLIHSLGFDQEQAISTSFKSKVTHLKSTTNLDLVVNLFKDCGLDDTQIRDIVSSLPRILFCKFNTLEPKIRAFQDLGLSGSDLVKVMKTNPNFIQAGLHTRIVPGIEFFRKLLGSDEKVVEAMINSKWLSSSEAQRRTLANALLLQNYGLSNEKIVTLVCRRYVLLQLHPEWLQDKLHYTEERLGIPRDSPMFFYGLYMVVSLSRSTIEKKVAVFRSFGWSESEVYALLRVQPMCLSKSEANLHNKLKFLMRELKYTPTYLTNFCALFSFSLEKRMRPRYEILKILKKKKLVSCKPSFATLAHYTEKQFVRFLQRFTDKVPNLLETYAKRIENASKTK